MEGARVSWGAVSRVREAVFSSRVTDWTKLLARFLSLELLVQALGFAAGVLLVRVLPKADYAVFTIANTMQQTMNLLADNGISAGLTSIGGRAWSDRFRFGQLLRTAMRLRRMFAVAAVLVATPILAWMLTSAGAGVSYTALICGVVLLGLYFQLTIGVLIVAPRLHLQVRRIQNLNFWSAVSRLVLILAAYALFLNAAVALAAATISFALQEFMLRRWLAEFADPSAPPNDSDHREILHIVKDQAPNSIYYCVQSQIYLWLISIFGSASSVAEVGALGRLGVVFMMLGSLMMNVVLPRFARVQEPQQIWRRYWQILGGFSAFALVLLLFTAIFPEALLWILGPKYAHLEKELFLMILGTLLVSVLAMTYELNLTKGWIVSPWLLIPIGVATEVTLIIALDLSQVRGVLLLTIYATIPGFFLNFWRTRKGLRELTASRA